MTGTGNTGQSGPELPIGLPIGLPESWSYWEDVAHDGVTNMATDQALLDTVRAGHATWRWYSWERPTVSFGRNERLAGRIDANAVTRAGLSAVRRPTGGRALLHWRELTYSVTMPLAAAVPWRAAYDAINQLLLSMLRYMEVPAVLAAGGQPVAPEGPVCFEAPAEGEIMIGGRKLVGSAVWREGDAYLQHGSLLLHDDQAMLQALHPGMPLPPPAASLSTALPGLPDDVIAARARDALRKALDAAGDRQRGDTGHVAPFVPDAAFHDALASHRARVSHAAWLWRR